MTTVDLIRSKEVLKEIKEFVSFFAEAQNFLHDLFINNLGNYLEFILIGYKETNKIFDYSVDFQKDKNHLKVLVKFSEEEPFLPVYKEVLK